MLTSVPAVTSDAGVAPLMLKRVWLPIVPSVEAELKFTTAPELATFVNPATVRSTEFTPVAPAVSVIVFNPCATLTLPSASVDAACARPK